MGTSLLANSTLLCGHIIAGQLNTPLWAHHCWPAQHSPVGTSLLANCCCGIANLTPARSTCLSLSADGCLVCPYPAPGHEMYLLAAGHETYLLVQFFVSWRQAMRRTHWCSSLFPDDNVLPACTVWATVLTGRLWRTVAGAQVCHSLKCSRQWGHLDAVRRTMTH